MRALALAVLVLFSTGCEPKAAQQAPPKPDDHFALQAEMQKVVDAAKKGPEAATKALEAYVATEDDLVKLYGEELGRAVYPAYRDKVVVKMKKQAGQVLAEQVGRGLDTVWAGQTGPAKPENTTPGDMVLLDAMPKKRPLFSVRFHREGEELGLRLNGFVHLDGRWIMLLKAYDHFPEKAPE